MASHMGINGFFKERIVHSGRNSFNETVLKPGFGQFISPILQPKESKKNTSSHLLEIMKEVIDESSKRRRVKRNALSFKLGHAFVDKRGISFRSCIESLICCKLVTDSNRVVSFDDPFGSLPVSVSSLTTFDPVVLSPKRLKDYLSLNVPKEYEEEFHDIVKFFRSRRQSFLNFNFGNEINIYQNNPNRGKAPKKGICSCEVCMKRTKNSRFSSMEDNIITNHHILPTRYGGENGDPFITNICVQCHNHGLGIESIISFFEDSARKMRLGNRISLMGKRSEGNNTEISAELARNSYPKVYPIDFLNLFSNAVALAMVCSYFNEDTVIKINELRAKRLAYSITPILLDLWQ
ncbi:MAG: hypothetical protein NTY68_02445 [Candidatus Micrarchaeota archaeon]|nr:hypothetical protein [Candidatus Micrarchaeota archaeon]